MAKTSVFAPLFEEGLQSINFFNGRLLSAEDLITERDAAREESRRLGVAIGDGIVSGLEVRKAEGSTAENPAVTVTPGVAINLYGDTIHLPKETDVSLLTARSESGAGVPVKVFGECKPLKAGSYRTGAGVYVLAIRPATGGTGLAPVSGLGNELAGCNTKYLVEGVRFVLVELPLDPDVLNDAARLRNRAAYACFGVQQEARLAADPFATLLAEATPIEKLRASGDLTTCSVPLALVHWTIDGVQFVDMWAVRRRAARRAGGTDRNQATAGGRLSAAGEARFWQFQRELDALRSQVTQARVVKARERFKYLPPAGLLPVGDVIVFDHRLRTSRTGFDPEWFFRDRTHADPLFLTASRARAALTESLAYPPIDVEGREFFWLYFIVENVRSIEIDGANVQPYVLFLNGQMNQYAEARFDLAQWGYSNYV